MSGIREVDPPQPHVLPVALYVGVFLALAGLTVATVAVTYLELGPFAIVVALAIAVAKATLVGAIFMHLLFDNKMHLAILNMSLIFLVTFIAMAMLDTEGRAFTDIQRRNFLPRDEAVAAQREKDPTHELRAFKDSWWKVRDAKELKNPDAEGATGH